MWDRVMNAARLFRANNQSGREIVRERMGTRAILLCLSSSPFPSAV